MMEIAFIGIGRMGLPMARNLAIAGHRIHAYDSAPQAAGSLKGVDGIEFFDSAVDAARGCEVVILMLPNSQIVDAVLTDAGVLAALERGMTIIDMGSSEPLETRRLAAEAARRGVDFVDAPVSGGTRGAEAGTLTIMVGGDPAVFQRVKPVLAHCGDQIQHVGAVGSGHAVKALNNLLSATSLLISSEALAIARSFGLDPESMLEAVNASSGRSFSTEMKLPTYVLDESYDSGFALELMLKDMRTAATLGAELGVPPFLGTRSIELWTEALDALPPGADHTEIARWVEARAGEDMEQVSRS